MEEWKNGRMEEWKKGRMEERKEKNAEANEETGKNNNVVSLIYENEVYKHTTRTISQTHRHCTKLEPGLLWGLVHFLQASSGSTLYLHRKVGCRRPNSL